MENKERPYIDEMDGLQNRGWEAMRKLLDEHLPEEEEKRRVIPFWKWMAAASLFLIIGLGYWKFQQKSNLNNSSTDRLSINKNVKPVKKNTILKNENLSNTDSSDVLIVKNIPHSNNVANRQLSNDNVSSRNNNPTIRKRKEKHFAFTTDKPVDSDNNITVSRKQIVNELSADDKSKKSSKLGNIGNSIASTNTMTENKLESSNGRIKIEMPTSKNLVKNQENKLAQQNKNANANDIEGQSGFRKRMNEALLNDKAEDDSIEIKRMAQAKKLQSDSQLIAARRKELQKYFGNDKEEKEEKKKDVKVDFAVLLNRNISDKGNVNSGNSLYDIPMYPSILASIKITNKIGFSTGISTAAPGNLSGTSASSSYASSDMMFSSAVVNTNNNKNFLNSNTAGSKELNLTSASYTNEVRQAYYWQIPLMVDYYVPVAHLRFSAGTDFSLVQKVLVVSGQSTELMSGNDYNSTGGIYQIRNFDPRLSLGAQYKFRKVLIGAKFSRSFLSAIEYNGLKTNGGNNQIFNVSMGYSLF